MKRWVVMREEFVTEDYPEANARLTQWLREGWEPFAAQHSDQLHHPTESWVWLRKEIEED